MIVNCSHLGLTGLVVYPVLCLAGIVQTFPNEENNIPASLGCCEWDNSYKSLSTGRATHKHSVNMADCLPFAGSLGAQRWG